MSFEHFYGREFWRFVFLQQEVAKLAKTAIKYPPMQAAASFNLDAVKKKTVESFVRQRPFLTRAGGPQ
jgi:arylsulfatase